MHRLFPGVPIDPYIVFSPTPTFVASTGMSPSGTMPAPRTPLSTMQQITGILTQPFTRERPAYLPTPQPAGTPLEAAERLRRIQQLQWSHMIHGTDIGLSWEKKREKQAELMDLERQTLQQLRGMGYPIRMRIQ